MIHVEGIDFRADEQDMEAAFRQAAHRLLIGHGYVKVWVSGDRNVPLMVTQDNYSRNFEQWVSDR